jgi:hypothetical protein
MKKYIFNLMILTLGAVLYTACTEDVGTEIGSDGAPYVSVYQYVASQPDDPDTDAALRVAANNKVSAVYYLAELTADKKERGLSDDAYADYVVNNGTQVELVTDSFSGGKYADFVAKNMKGEYTISVVGVDGGKKAMASTKFTGLDWVTVAEGTYKFGARAQQVLSVDPTTTTTLQYLKTDTTLYRFKFLYGFGLSLQARLTEEVGDNEGDPIYYLRVEPQTLAGYTFGSYGTVGVRDLGYWQDDDSFAYDPDYGCWIMDDNYCNIALSYFGSNGKNITYAWDEFIPN